VGLGKIRNDGKDGGGGLLESKGDLGAKKAGGVRAAMVHCCIRAAACWVLLFSSRPCGFLRDASMYTMTVWVWGFLFSADTHEGWGRGSIHFRGSRPLFL
jgi:hypothetical protein